MNSKDFDKIVNERCSAILGTLASKAKEYASNDDRLHNFKEAARLEGIHPIEALQGMLLKHIVSVGDMRRDYVAGKTHSDAMINEKIGDHINYLILLEALMKERNKAVFDAVNDRL